jgi:hypothetical protein
MMEYRAYLLGENGHIIERIDLFGADEGTARARAATLAIDHDVELWERAKPVAIYRRQRATGSTSE